MWKNTYKDYKPDDAVIKCHVETGKGIIGCEMHERNGWGHSHQIPLARKRGLLTTLLNFLLRRRVK